MLDCRTGGIMPMDTFLALKTHKLSNRRLYERYLNDSPKKVLSHPREGAAWDLGYNFFILHARTMILHFFDALVKFLYR